MSRLRGRGLTSAGGGRARGKRETAFGGDTLGKLFENGPPGSPREDVGFKAFKTRGRDETNPAVEALHAKQVQLLEDMEKKARDRKAKAERIRSEEKTNHEAIMKELKGKDYTFHSDGDVVVLNPPAYDSLAPVTTTPRINITQEEQLLRSDDSQTRIRRNKKKKNKDNKKKKPEIDDSEFYQEDDSLQPALIDTVMLVGGVDLYEGEKERRGPPIEPDPSHMNRREYMALSAPPPETVPFAEPTVSLKDLEAQAEAEAAAAAAAAALAADSPEPVKIDDVFLEDDLVPHPPEAKPDANMEMVQSETWGVNPVNAREYLPGPPPRKPNMKQRSLTAKLTGGEKVKNPRDRPFITSSPRKKLPAPPLGKTTGHGHPTHGAPLSSSSLGFNNSENKSYFPMVGRGSPVAMSGTASPGPAPKSFKTAKQKMAGGQMARTEIAKQLLQMGVL